MFPVFLSLRLPSWCFGFRFVLEVLVFFRGWFFGFRFVLEVLVFFRGWCLVSDLYLRYLSSSLGGVWFQICT
jgi:hypothetical protein